MIGYFSNQGTACLHLPVEMQRLQPDVYSPLNILISSLFLLAGGL